MSVRHRASPGREEAIGVRSPGPAAGEVCDRIVRVYTELSRRDDLAPAPDVDALFGELVRLCVAADDADGRSVLADDRVRQLAPDLLRLCSDGETLLERFWCHRLLAADDPHAELARFPYLENYRQLTRLELHALAGAGIDVAAASHLCFVGGGPLPVSALLLHRQLGVRVDVVDRTPEAVGLSRRLLRRLVPGPGVEVVHADAASGTEMARVLAGCDVVFVAALVGRTRSEKRAVLQAIGSALDAGAALVVRSAHGLRSLLYPVVDLSDVAEAAGCVPQVLVHPLGDVVNSVLVARRR